MPSPVPPLASATKAGPLPSSGFHRFHRYYEPLGLPPGSLTLRTRLIARVFARRGRPGRASPVPHQPFATCRPPYPGGVLRRLSGPADAVCCLRPDMTGSASTPFGSNLTGLQRFIAVRPAASLPSRQPYGHRRASDAPLRRRDLSPRPEPATRRTGLLTVTGLTPAGLVRLTRTRHDCGSYGRSRRSRALRRSCGGVVAK
jgi:hypothetical protein